MPECKAKACFVEPMLLLRKERLPEEAGWVDEIKLDGYRALATKSGGKLQLCSRYPAIAAALRALRDETVVDGEVVRGAAVIQSAPELRILGNGTHLLRLRRAHPGGMRREG